MTARLGRRFLGLIVPLLCLAILSACGGGGSSSDSSSVSQQAASSSSSGSSTGSSAAGTLTAPAALTVSATTSEGAPLYQGAIQVTGGSPSTTYYYSASFTGTAIASMTLEGTESVETGITTPVGPTAGRITAREGATVSAAYSAINNIQMLMLSPSILGAGTFTDTITFSVCYDPGCNEPVAGSPQNVTVTYVITGNPNPDTSFTLAVPSVTLEAPTSGSAGPTTSLNINTLNLPPTGAYVFVSATPGVGVASASFNSNLNGTGTLSITAKPPASLGSGIYSDTLQVNICFDSACTKPAVTGPLTVSVRYLVDASPGVDFTMNTIPVQVSQMAWSPTNQRIYAIVPGYAESDANSFIVINPVTASIEAVLPLSSPGPVLSLSDDGQYAYAYESILNEIVQIDLATLSVDETIPMPGSTSVTASAVAPGAPNALAVDTYNDYTTLSVFDGTVQRSQTFSSGSLESNLLVAWGTDASTLYAYDNTNLTGTLYQLGASSTGLTVVQETSSISANDGSFLTGLEFVNGLLYFNTGFVFDPTTTAPMPGFTMQATAGSGTPYGFAIDPTLSRAFFQVADWPQGQTSGMTVEAFNLATQQPTWLARFPSSGSTVTGLIRWGSNGLAFSTTDGSTSEVTLISGPVVSR